MCAFACVHMLLCVYVCKCAVYNDKDKSDGTNESEEILLNNNISGDGSSMMTFHPLIDVILYVH